MGLLLSTNRINSSRDNRYDRGSDSCRSSSSSYNGRSLNWTMHLHRQLRTVLTRDHHPLTHMPPRTSHHRRHQHNNVKVEAAKDTASRITPATRVHLMSDTDPLPRPLIILNNRPNSLPPQPPTNRHISVPHPRSPKGGCGASACRL